jgi:hypothetical protein
MVNSKEVSIKMSPNSVSSKYLINSPYWSSISLIQHTKAPNNDPIPVSPIENRRHRTENHILKRIQKFSYSSSPLLPRYISILSLEQLATLTRTYFNTTPSPMSEETLHAYLFGREGKKSPEKTSVKMQDQGEFSSPEVAEVKKKGYRIKEKEFIFGKTEFKSKQEAKVYLAKLVEAMKTNSKKIQERLKKEKQKWEVKKKEIQRERTK